MRAFVFALGAVVVAAGAALPADAQTEPRRSKAYAKREAPAEGRALPRGDGYRQHLADKLPYGSQAWWDQMQREGRLGGETP